jgi:hypothetical protein
MGTFLNPSLEVEVWDWKKKEKEGRKKMAGRPGRDWEWIIRREIRELVLWMLCSDYCYYRPLGTFWRAARVGERLSPYVSLCCVAMAVSSCCACLACLA